MLDSRTRRSGAWLRTMTRSPVPRIRLVCFPHAGGAASFFRPWADLVSAEVELFAVRYPGREDRIVEPFAERFDDLVEAVVEECLRLADAPLAFFGHSMGASVAYEVALRLQLDHGIRLRGLFVSARSAPDHEKKSDLAGAADDKLVEHLTELGGTNVQALEHPELLDLVLPAIRADYRLVESYEPTIKGAVLDTPISVYYGDAEEDLSEESVMAWSAVTTGPFRTRSFEGGHFYLTDHLPVLVADMLTTFGRT
ncbi:pyochelin biosynthetic protein PchC [Streptosporangium subroseum]|uniref:Pyochelin biosynthetic protein PchC n=1 Tax=Streptosporangium subroseum TaxID=106412 RepID=A0A239NI76_9ACTN|nr:alpha/beta fold hydrolase [Streptosporangium subroseum]SNT54480.1 pyochelin biosynthetic protein PchC [Streptosporangium subroseum]